MDFTRYLSLNRVVILKSKDKVSAITELIDLICQENSNLCCDQVLEEIWARENQLTTKIARGLAIPHAKIPTLPQPIIAVGKSIEGIHYDLTDDNKVFLIVMIVSNDEKYLKNLSEIANTFDEEKLYKKIIAAPTPEKIYDLLTNSYKKVHFSNEQLKVSRSLVKHAQTLLKEMEAKAILLHVDAVGDIDFLKNVLDWRNVILITNHEEKYQDIFTQKIEIIQVPFEGPSRYSQIEITLLFILAQGIIKRADKVISVYGKKNSGIFDTISFIDIDKEFKAFFPANEKILPLDLQQAVFVRAIQLANDLGQEGREGKPIGSIFVLGDYDHVKNHCQQMLLNPFKGLTDDERNILNPILEDTIKEYSKLDGAFIIRGDGVIVSVGTYLGTNEPLFKFSQGLGARHAAAASITSETKAIAIVISESTSKVSIFISGERLIMF